MRTRSGSEAGRAILEPADARLVSFGGARERHAALRLADRLAREGIPSMLVPALHRPGAFDVALARDAASEAARRLTVDPAASGGVFRTAAIPELEEPLPLRARKVAAFFAVGVGFGLGHLYAREHLAALILALGQVACVVLACVGTVDALWGFPLLMLVDAWGAVAAVDRENDGQRRDAPQQLASTLPAVAFVIAAATVIANGVATREEPRATVTELR